MPGQFLDSNANSDTKKRLESFKHESKVLDMEEKSLKWHMFCVTFIGAANIVLYENWWLCYHDKQSEEACIQFFK